MHCPSCHAGGLIRSTGTYNSEQLLDLLDRKKRLVNKVVICGGEPTLEPDLEDFIRRLKEMGLLVNLNTNGTNPEVLRRLQEQGLVDYLAMDVKGPRELYGVLTGLGERVRIEDVEASVKLAPGFPDYEFRTTLVPYLKGEELTWMNSQDALSMISWIRGLGIKAGDKAGKHYLQRFVARPRGIMIDDRFSLENLPEEYREFPQSLQKEIQAAGKEVGYDFQLR